MPLPLPAPSVPLHCPPPTRQDSTVLMMAEASPPKIPGVLLSSHGLGARPQHRRPPPSSPPQISRPMTTQSPASPSAPTPRPEFLPRPSSTAPRSPPPGPRQTPTRAFHISSTSLPSLPGPGAPYPGHVRRRSSSSTPSSSSTSRTSLSSSTSSEQRLTRPSYFRVLSQGKKEKGLKRSSFATQDAYYAQTARVGKGDSVEELEADAEREWTGSKGRREGPLSESSAEEEEEWREERSAR